MDSFSENPPIYPIVNGNTDSVHGERLVATPATNTNAKLNGVNFNSSSVTSESMVFTASKRLDPAAVDLAFLPLVSGKGGREKRCSKECEARATGRAPLRTLSAWNPNDECPGTRTCTSDAIIAASCKAVRYEPRDRFCCCERLHVHATEEAMLSVSIVW